jgi:hypothetical protein
MNTKLLKKARRRVFISSDIGPIDTHNFFLYKRSEVKPIRLLVYVGGKRWRNIKRVGVANSNRPYKLFYAAWNRRCNEVVNVARMLNSSWYNYYFK